MGATNRSVNVPPICLCGDFACSMSFMILSFLRLFLVIRVHVRRSQAGQFQRGKHETVPCKYAMAAKVRVPREGCQIFLAGREIGSGVDFGPEAIGDGFVSPLPAVEFA